MANKELIISGKKVQLKYRATTGLMRRELAEVITEKASNKDVETKTFAALQKYGEKWMHLDVRERTSTCLNDALINGDITPEEMVALNTTTIDDVDRMTTRTIELFKKCVDWDAMKLTEEQAKEIETEAFWMNQDIIFLEEEVKFFRGLLKV